MIEAALALTYLSYWSVVVVFTDHYYPTMAFAIYALGWLGMFAIAVVGEYVGHSRAWSTRRARLIRYGLSVHRCTDAFLVMFMSISAMNVGVSYWTWKSQAIQEFVDSVPMIVIRFVLACAIMFFVVWTIARHGRIVTTRMLIVAASTMSLIALSFAGWWIGNALIAPALAVAVLIFLNKRGYEIPTTEMMAVTTR